MFLVSLYRAIKFSLQDFWRNIWLSLITIFIVVLTLLLVNILITINVLANYAVKSVEDKVDISIYFDSKATEKQVLEVKARLLELPVVKGVEYISKEEALKDFKIKHQNEPEVLESVKELEKNPLPATLIIKAKDPQHYQAIIGFLNDNKDYGNLIEDQNFNDHKEMIKRINNITSRVYQVGIILSLIFALVVVLIVFNTVRIAIYTHREEIGIMKLVGANNWFVRSPFLLEGVLYSLLACVLAVIITYPLLGVVQSYASSFFDSGGFNLVNYFNGHFLIIFGLEFLVMALLNVLSTSWATRRYLKV